eukprot:7567546-Pyramimonas_sp.AAC.1
MVCYDNAPHPQAQSLTACYCYVAARPQVLHQFFNANKRRAKVVFDEFDIDGGGSLDVQNEMVFFLKRLMPTVSKEQLKYFGTMIDIDGDGAVDFDELLSAVKEMHDLGSSLSESYGLQ